MKTDKEGLIVGEKGKIATYTGWIDPLNPDPNDINIVDIAHHLSQQVRWTGACKRFYSVAEHLVRCVWCLPKATPHIQMMALLHDAPEAYTGDLSKPLKASEDLGEPFLRVERELGIAVGIRFKIDPDPRASCNAVRDADNWMLWMEARQLIPHLGELMPIAPPVARENNHTRFGWPADWAEETFLHLFRELNRNP